MRHRPELEWLRLLVKDSERLRRGRGLGGLGAPRAHASVIQALRLPPKLSLPIESRREYASPLRPEDGLSRSFCETDRTSHGDRSRETVRVLAQSRAHNLRSQG